MKNKIIAGLVLFSIISGTMLYNRTIVNENLKQEIATARQERDEAVEAKEKAQAIAAAAPKRKITEDPKVITRTDYVEDAEEAHESGYSEGEDEGYKRGYEVGFEDGAAEGYSQGYEDAINGEGW